MKVHRKSNEQKPGQQPSGLTSGLGLALQFSFAFQSASLAETMYSARGYYLLTHPCIPFMNIFELQALFFLLDMHVTVKIKNKASSFCQQGPALLRAGQW